MKAFAIFEGGGAKGYAHIGGLRAAEMRGFEFEAVAGTSIGAIIACLVAAGYTSHEIFDVTPEGDRVGVLSQSPIQYLDAKDWNRFTHATGYGRKQSWFRDLVKKALTSKLSKWFRRTFVQLWIWLICFALPILTLRHMGITRALFNDLGVTNAHGLKTLLEEALRNKLALPAGQRVSFRHLRKPLKVIAADLVTEKLILFPDTPDDSVVDAVVASASFPLFFTPAIIKDRVLIDGGILSNRPVWVFDDERQLLEESIPTVAFLLADKPLQDKEVRPSKPPSSIYSYIVKMFRTAAFGNQRLETRAVDDYLPVPLMTDDVETLDLEDAFRRAPELIARAERDAKACFDKQIGPREPTLMKEVLQSLGVTLYEDLRLLGADVGEVQCSIVMRTTEGLARVSYASYQPASDYGVKIRIDSPGPAQCFALREPIITIVDGIPREQRENPFFKYEHALRNPQLKTLYSVPIFEDEVTWDIVDATNRPDPIAVLTIGTEGLLANYFSLPEVEDALATYAQILAFGLSRDANVAWIRSASVDLAPTRAPGANLLPVGNSNAFLKSDRLTRHIAPSAGAVRFFSRLPDRFLMCAL